MEARRFAFPDRRSRSAGVRGSARCPHNERAKFALRAAGLLAALVGTTALQAATVSTQNFVVHAPTDEVARQVAETAEMCRRELAIVWLGKELPAWYRPCPIKVKVGQIGAGGATTFTFEGGEVFGWNMNVQGTLERILDSVIPHEVSHTIFASHFRRPLPRWADEGAATLVEHESERLRQTKLLNQVIRTSRRIPLQQLLEITEYPEDMQQVLTLYAEGYSLADFLVQQKGEQGRATYLAFLADAHENNWSHAFREHYGYENIQDVERNWSTWIAGGSEPLSPSAGGTLLADAEQTPPATPTQSNPEPRNQTALASTAAASPRPLAPIQRPLKTRVAGRELDAPEPNVTAMPQREPDVQLGPSATEATAATSEASIPLQPSAPSGDSETEPAVLAADSAPRNRVPRPSSNLPPANSLRAVNAGYDEAFRQ
jgi:hypothetical protein